VERHKMKMPRGERDRQMEVNASLRWNDRRRKEGERERERGSSSWVCPLRSWCPWHSR